jgi:hypothetical protein
VAKKLSVFGTTEPRYFFTSSGCSRIASEIEQKMTPAFFQFLLEGGDDRDAVEHRVDGDAAHPSSRRHAPDFLLLQRNAELLVGLEQLRVDLVERLRLRLPSARRSNSAGPDSRSADS